MEQLPPTKFIRSELETSSTNHESLVGIGCVLEGARILGSLLSNRVQIHDHSRVEETVVLPDVDIGEGSRLRRAILARGCRIPRGLVVGEDPEDDARRFKVTPEGITLITPMLLQRNVG